MSTLDTIRTAVPATARAKYYTYVAAGVLLMSGLGVVTETVASLWSAAGLASVTLVFALLHSLSPWRTALYGFLATLAPLALWYSIGTATQWVAVLSFAATVFGITKAASNTAPMVVPVLTSSNAVIVGEGLDAVAALIGRVSRKFGSRFR
ncbi:phage holin [Williamsia sp.]|uniref:phage holin n=1 Tax=Williamsia sp. TaxID=1872085 RepID=UPI002F9407EB